MKRFVALGFLLLVLSACVNHRMSGEQVAQINQLYETGEYELAADAYQGLVDAGVDDGTLYYNLANSYFKAGDLGRAILNYRRAQRLLPRDSDVVANLRLARAQTRDRLETEDASNVIGLARRVLMEWTTLDESALILLLLWIMLCALATAAIVWPSARQWLDYGIRIVVGMLVLVLFSIGIRLADEHGRTPGVILADSVDAHSGPGTEYVTEFSLHAGAEIRVLDERRDWNRITLPGNLQGWVPSQTVEEL